MICGGCKYCLKIPFPRRVELSRELESILKLASVKVM